MIFVIHNRYTGSRDTINITHKKISLSNETNQLHPKQTSIRYEKGFEKKQIAIESKELECIFADMYSVW